MELNVGTQPIDRAKSRIDDIIQRAKNPQPVLEVLAVDLETMIADGFDNGSAPSGEPWLPLKPSTLLKRALSRGGKRARVKKGSRRGYNVGVSLGLSSKALKNISNVKTLVDTARGRNSIKVRVVGRSIVITSNVEYMRAHLGGDTKRTPPRPPRRQWAPVLWDGSRWVYDARGRGKIWALDANVRVRRYVLRGEA